MADCGTNQSRGQSDGAEEQLKSGGIFVEGTTLDDPVDVETYRICRKVSHQQVATSESHQSSKTQDSGSVRLPVFNTAETDDDKYFPIDEEDEDTDGTPGLVSSSASSSSSSVCIWSVHARCLRYLADRPATWH